MTATPPDGPRAVRLQKFLSRAGIASRRHGEQLIAGGRVSIDGTVVTQLGTRVQVGEQVVRVDGQRVDLRPERWVAVYKPAGYLTTRKDGRGRPTVYSLLPDEMGGLFHVGRLDRLSEGLLILTNDGETAHRLLHPSYGLARRYAVDVMGQAGRAEAERLEKGVRLDDGLARAEEVRFERLSGATCRFFLTLREGRKREVRRMMDVLDLVVRRLVRVEFGPVALANLSPGEYRELGVDEVKALRAAVELEDYDGDT